MNKNKKQFDDESFFKLVSQLSKKDQIQILWYMRWLVFRGQFKKEAIKKRLQRLIVPIRARWERHRLKRIQHPINKEINNLWKKAKNDYKLKVYFQGNFSSVVETLYEENNYDLQSQIYLQPWLAILDQGILWLMSLYFAFDEGEKPARKNTMAIQSLIGAACVQANAIHLLCKKGLELPAKAILRSFLETLISCIIIMYDENLRKGYMKANTPHKSWKFWSKHLREKSLIEKLRLIFIEQGVEEEKITEFNSWISEEFGVTSEAVHPSYVSAVFATHPFPLVGEIFPLGILGSPTALSQKTLSTASKFLWFFSVVSMGFLLEPQKGKRKPLLKLKKYTTTSKIFAVSYSIYWQLVHSYWDYEDIPSNIL